MLFKRKKGEEKVSITHYAPDVTLTPVDYSIPFDHEKLTGETKRQIREFLAKTKPDALCETFYDPYAKAQEDLFTSLLHMQAVEHHDAGASIADKHLAEKKRLESAIAQQDQLIEAIELQIEALQERYDRYNS